jgi:peroxiredoxin
MRGLSLGALLLLGACATASPPVAPASPVTAEDPTPAAPSIVVTDAMGTPHIGDVAPDFELPDQDGHLVKLSAARGSVVVLAFVASFCPFSKAEQPYLAKLPDEYAGKNVKVIAIEVDEPEADYRSYLARVPMHLPVLRDDGGTVTLRFTPPGAQPELVNRKMALITSNLVIDPQGKIRFFTMADTVHFDAKLVHLRRTLDQVLSEHAG